MPILDAAVAFALTMFVVATVVTQIVRLLQHAASLRARELQKMLKEYFDNEIGPVVKRETHRLAKNIQGEIAKKLIQATDQFNSDKLIDEAAAAKLVEISTEELTESLKRSDLGAALLTDLGDEAKAVFDELGRRYEVVGNRFTESFRKSSRRWATGVALVLALVINIDSIHIASSYIRNENLREGVVAQMEFIVAKYEATVASADEVEGEGTKEALIKAVGDTREQIDLLASSGFPIGWSYFPHAGLRDKTSKEFVSRNHTYGWLWWALGVALTAFLAGRGAPFWYDTLTGISRAAQRARAAKKSSS